MNESEQLARTKLGMVNERHMDRSVLLSADDLRELLRLLDEARADLARAVEREARREALEGAAKVADEGRFLHDDAPDARFGKACAAAIRALMKEGLLRDQQRDNPGHE